MKTTRIHSIEKDIIEIMVNGEFYTATVETSFSEINNFEREFDSIEIDNDENLSDELIEQIENAIKFQFDNLDIFLNR